MKKLELKPSDYTNDAIYTAFEYLNSRIEDVYFQKLEELNAMYKLIQKNLYSCMAPDFTYVIEDNLELIWDRKNKNLYIKDECYCYNLLSAPKEYRLRAEEVMPDFIRKIADNIESQLVEIKL